MSWRKQWWRWWWRADDAGAAFDLGDEARARLWEIARRHRPTEDERRSLQRASAWMAAVPLTRGRMGWGEFVIALTPAAVYLGVIFALFGLGGFNAWFIFIAVPIQVVLTILAMGWLSRTVMRPKWQLILRRAGYPVCLRCGHVMEGLDERGACPECGFDHHDAPTGGDG